MSPDSGSLAPPNGMVPQAHALGNPGHQRMTTVHPGLPNTRQSYIRIYTWTRQVPTNLRFTQYFLEFYIFWEVFDVK